MITVKSIVYQPKDAKLDRHTPGYVRHPLAEATLIEGYGIQGDRKGGHPNRNLNIMDDATQAELEAEGYPVGVGVLGENIILGGTDLRTLPEGTRLRLGGEAIILLGKARVGCEQLTLLDARMPESVQGRVGFMCRVVRSGRIKVGDLVETVAEPVRG